MKPSCTSTCVSAEQNGPATAGHGLFCIIDRALSGPCCHGSIPDRQPLEGGLAKLWPLESLPVPCSPFWSCCLPISCQGCRPACVASVSSHTVNKLYPTWRENWEACPGSGGHLTGNQKQEAWASPASGTARRSHNHVLV